MMGGRGVEVGVVGGGMHVHYHSLMCGFKNRCVRLCYEGKQCKV